MIKLLCVARWPEDDRLYPENPVEFELVLQDEGPGGESDWIVCNMIVRIQPALDAPWVSLIERQGRMLRRDLQRLVNDLKVLHERHLDSLTFVPVTPSFELWLHRLSDDQYRVIVWQDMADEFAGANEIVCQGVRFTTNRARLMGFARGLEARLVAL